MKHYQPEIKIKQDPEDEVRRYLEYYTRKMLDGCVIHFLVVESDFLQMQQDPYYRYILQLISENKIVLA